MRSAFLKRPLRLQVQHKGLSATPLWQLLKLIVPKQQIQQMSHSDEDNGLTIFSKLKGLFFQENLDDDQISSIVRDDPLKAIDHILVNLTQHYGQKVEEIVENFEEEKQSLNNHLTEMKQKLQHSMDDNQFFKTLIDKLEDDKKEVDLRLNQSQDQINRSNHEFQIIAGENAKIKYTAMEAYKNYQFLLGENSQFKSININLEKELITLKAEHETLTLSHKHLMKTNKEILLRHITLEEQNNKMRQQNEIILQKINEKEEFISTFISQYNKMHFFQHQESFQSTEHKISTDVRDNDELKEFNFNQYDKDSILSLSLQSSRRNSMELKQTYDEEMDQKFSYINATILKKKDQETKGCSSQQKQHIYINSGPLNVVKHSIRKLSPTFQLNIPKGKHKNIKPAPRTSRDMVNATHESNHTHSDQEESKMTLEEAFKRKLVEKNGKIKKLEKEVDDLKNQYLLGRQKMTEMQGGYEIQIDQLKGEADFFKMQFTNLYQKFVLSDTENKIYKEKVNELEELIAKNSQQNNYYCEELKSRCKTYIIQKINQIQQAITKQASTPRLSDHQSLILSSEDILEQSQFMVEQKQQNFLKVHEDVENQIFQERLISSGVSSYKQLSNHCKNGFDLELNLSTVRKSNQYELNEVYIRETFEIQSDLGGFTERLIVHQQEQSKYKSHLTDSPNSMPSFHPLQSSLSLSFHPQIIQIPIHPSYKSLSFVRLQSINIIPDDKDTDSNQKNFNEIGVDTLFFSINDEYINGLDQQKNETLDQNVFKQEKNNQKKLKLQLCNSLVLDFRRQRKQELASNIVTFCNKKVKLNSKISQFRSYYHLDQPNNLYNHSQTQTQLEFFNQLQNSEPISFTQKSTLKIVNVISLVATYSDKQMEQNGDQNLPKVESSMNKVQVSDQIQQIFLTLQSEQMNMLLIERANCKKNMIVNENQMSSQLSSKHQYGSSFNIHYSQHLTSASHTQDNIIYLPLSGLIEKRIENRNSASIKRNATEPDQTEIKSKKQTPNWENKKTHSQGLRVEKQEFFQENIKIDELNRGVIWGRSILKQERQKSDSSCNPESKLLLPHQVQQASIRITPWIQDQKKNSPVKDSFFNSSNIPEEVSKELTQDQSCFLSKFLKKYKIKIKYKEKIDESHFRRPQNLKKKLLVVKASQKDKSRTFLMNSQRLFCLEDGAYLKMDKQKYIDSNNFMFGQSEVVITGDSRLIISREGKKNKLEGNMDDGSMENIVIYDM